MEMECRHDRANREGRERNLAEVAEMEARAVRITAGELGRCFELPNGRLVTITNEQPPDSEMLHIQFILPLMPEWAEDGYGWAPR
jgi:hypothetical protein